MDKKRITVIAKKEKSLLKTIELFIKSNYTSTDVELSEELKKNGYDISSSSVGRYLTDSFKDYIVFLSESGDVTKAKEYAELYKIIVFKRKQNKELGRKKGGKNSVHIKDEKGKFKGSKSRG